MRLIPFALILMLAIALGSGVGSVVHNFTGSLVAALQLGAIPK